MHSHKSLIGAVEVTKAFHRPHMKNSQKSRSSSLGIILQNQFNSQNKTKLDPSYDTLRSLLINWLNKVRCLESIGMLKSTQKYEKTRFWDSAELTRSRRQDTRSCDPLQGTLTRSCHPETRSCHSTSTVKMKFYVFVHKILFSSPISVPFSPMHS